jgi:hypothetical protein
MTPEDRELTNWLCRQIQEEQDPKRFSELVWQLDALLAMNHNALHDSGQGHDQILIEAIEVLVTLDQEFSYDCFIIAH